MVSGHVGERFGRKRTLLVTLVVVTLASMEAALRPMPVDSVGTARGMQCGNVDPDEGRLDDWTCI